jgi:hypothetical protein
MDNIYREIKSSIDKIELSNLWPGFKPYEFALYDDGKVYFETFEIPISNQFVGNTSINYEGKQIAIWKIEETDLNDIDLLTSSIIHEMFHAHQMTFGDNRFFNDLDGLSYPLEYENFNLKINESRLLASAIREQNYNIKEEFFKKFLSVRQRRFDLIGDNSTYEKSIETIEGTAEYLALASLKIMNHDSYIKQLEKAMNRITTINENFFDVRRMAYYTGALICLLADELSIDCKRAIEPDLQYNYDLITEKYSVETNMVIELDENIEIHGLIDERNIRIRELVDEIMASSNVEIIEGEFSVRGYDPMNMMRSDHFVYHKHFLGIQQDCETDFIMGPIVIETNGKDFSKFSRYYKITNNQ